MTVRRYTFYLLLAFVFSLPWQNAFSIGGSRTLSSLMGVVVVWLTLSVVLAEWRLARPTGLLITMILFCAWQFSTILWSIDPALTQGRAIRVIQLVAMVWVIGELAESEQQRRSLMQAFVVGCFVVIAAVVQSYGSGVPIEGYRYSPLQFSLNETADTLALGIAMALILLTHSKTRVLSWVNMAFIPLAVFAVILTASRSGFVATCLALVGVPFVLRATKPVYRVVWVALILGVFAFLFFGMPSNSSLQENLRRVTFSQETETVRTMTGRTDIWAAAFSVLREHPAVGIGAGTFATGVASRLDRARSPHNLFVSVAVETGLVGLFFLCAVLVSSLVPAIRGPSDTKALYLVLFAVLFATALVANVDTSKVLWFGLALLSLAGREPVLQHSETDAYTSEPLTPLPHG